MLVASLWTRALRLRSFVLQRGRRGYGRPAMSRMLSLVRSSRIKEEDLDHVVTAIEESAKA